MHPSADTVNNDAVAHIKLKLFSVYVIFPCYSVGIYVKSAFSALCDYLCPGFCTFFQECRMVLLYDYVMSECKAVLALYMCRAPQVKRRWCLFVQ